jgi:hypothetical protein
MPPLFTGLWCGKSTPVCGGFPLSDTLARLEITSLTSSSLFTVLKVFRSALFDFYLHDGGSATKTRCRERPFYQRKTGWDSQAFGEESGRYCISTIHVNLSIQTDFLQVITLAVRTPLTKARKGGLKDTPLDDLLIALLKV